MAAGILVGGVCLAEGEAYRGKVFVGIAGEEVELPRDRGYEETRGLKIARLPAGGSGRAAGLRAGDIVVSIAGRPLAEGDTPLSRSFGVEGNKARPADVVPCVILRGGPGDPIEGRAMETVEIELLRYPRTTPDEPRAPSNAVLRPDLAGVAPSCEKLCRELIEEGGIAGDCRDLMDRLDRCDQFPDPDRLPIIRYVRRDPFKLEAAIHSGASSRGAGRPGPWGL